MQPQTNHRPPEQEPAPPANPGVAIGAPRRFVLLGASNLTYGFPLIVESLVGSSPDAIEMFAAHGHGRSYGRWSRVLHRALPGIASCRLWEDLAAQPACPTAALITDVGNDLLFGADPTTILGWVEACIERVAAISADLTITRLPLKSVHRLSSVRYHATRLVFFPIDGPDWPSMQRMMVDLDTGLQELAARHAAHLVVPRREWYGVDPIHIRRAMRPSAWEEILGTWSHMERLSVVRPSLRQAVQLWRVRPAERRLLGRTQRAAPPVHSPDGSRVFLY